MTVNDRETQFPGVIYTFSATLVNDIPLNGKLKLTFPAEYTDFSRMECEVIINNLKSQVPCTETGNVVSLTSFSNPALTDIAVAATS